MTVDELFNEFANCFAVLVDNGNSSQISFVEHFSPEDRCGDDTQSMVTLLDDEICIEPSDVVSIKNSSYIVTVELKNGKVTHFQFLECKRFKSSFGQIDPHPFEVFEGDDPHNESTWCKHCNTARNEVDGMHIDVY
jgi:hypothetical protein